VLAPDCNRTVDAVKLLTPAKLVVPLISTRQILLDVFGNVNSVLIGVALDALVNAASLYVTVYLVNTHWLDGKSLSVSVRKLGTVLAEPDEGPASTLFGA
jgi:hypothetical protein